MDVNNVHSETPERENLSNASQTENTAREPLNQDRNLAEETSSSMPIVTLEITDQVTGSNQVTMPNNGPSVRSPSVDGTPVVNGHWDQEQRLVLQRLVLEQRLRLELAHLTPGPEMADKVYYL